MCEKQAKNFDRPTKSARYNSMTVQFHGQTKKKKSKNFPEFFDVEHKIIYLF